MAVQTVAAKQKVGTWAQMLARIPRHLPNSSPEPGTSTLKCSRKRRFQYYICTTISRKSSRLTETLIPVLHLYYDFTKIQPAHGNVDSSTTFVLRFHENPAGSRKRRFQYYICTTISRKSSRLTETSIPVLHLYYDLTKIQLAHGNIDSSTKFVLRIDERFQTLHTLFLYNSPVQTPLNPKTLKP